MDKKTVREFLVTGRARVTPEQVGIPAYGGRPDRSAAPTAVERPTGALHPAGAAVRALGWCVVDELGQEPEPETPQQLGTEIVPDDRCAELDGELCSEHPTDEAQVCSTDSGSPMVRGGEGGWELVGPTSRDGDYDESVACAGPWAFTEAARYGDRVADTVGKQPPLGVRRRPGAGVPDPGGGCATITG